MVRTAPSPDDASHRSENHEAPGAISRPRPSRRFARAYALAVYKSPGLADMREAAAGLSAILDIEMNLHVKLCAGWGLSPSDLEQTPPAVEMLA